MVFNSVQYALFLPAVLLVYWQLRRRGQNVLLLIASYAFYAMWDWRFLGLMLLSTAIDYVVGRSLEVVTDDRRRRLLFATSLVVNLGILGFFKYFNFFVDSATSLLHRAGLDAAAPTLRVLLPVGISFYTFHGISYTFDVYRRHIRAAKDPIDFAVFVAFFPQLVAGPIGRAHLQLPQFENDRTRPDWPQVRSALFLILLGLFKKVAIADALAPFANNAFSSANGGWVNLTVAMYAFAFQIYADFSGYSDMARGSARLLGVELPLNFNQPYLSRNITEFWRRWHISLSNWLRDYLYVPLGGNRGSSLVTYRNLGLTMLLGGLWHGAAWTFVIWGAIHGSLLALHKWWTGRRPAPATEAVRGGWREVGSILVTFHVVCLAWIFFRAESLREALRFVKGIVTFRGGVVDLDAIGVVIPAMVIMVAIDIAQRMARDHEVVLAWRPIYRGVAYTALVLPIIVYSGATPVPFIYFQF